jgi:hypothetical protein
MAFAITLASVLTSRQGRAAASSWSSRRVAGRWPCVCLYGIVRSKLELLRFPAPYEDKLSLFGTVGTGVTNAGCRRGGPLIVLGRSPTSATGRRWRFDRTDYRLAGDRFAIVRQRSTVVPEGEMTKVSQRWGWTSSRSHAAPSRAAAASDPFERGWAAHLTPAHACARREEESARVSC